MQMHKIHIPVYAFMAAAIGLVLDVLTGRSSAKAAPLRMLWLRVVLRTGGASKSFPPVKLCSDELHTQQAAWFLRSNAGLSDSVACRSEPHAFTRRLNRGRKAMVLAETQTTDKQECHDHTCGH